MSRNNNRQVTSRLSRATNNISLTRLTNGNMNSPTLTVPDVHKHVKQATVDIWKKFKKKKKVLITNYLSRLKRWCLYTYHQKNTYDPSRGFQVCVVTIDDDARIEGEVGWGGASAVVWVRVPGVDRTEGRFALASTGTISAQVATRPAARYLKVL